MRAIHKPDRLESTLGWRLGRASAGLRTAVIYSTFIGGSVDPGGNASTDQSSALTVDSNGDVIVTGTTSSTNFPLKNPIPAGTATSEDGFLVSLTPDGFGLHHSSRA